MKNSAVEKEHSCINVHGKLQENSLVICHLSLVLALPGVNVRDPAQIIIWLILFPVQD
jgi:hypothetical protein